ncbi:hypothetical protein TBLA_0F03550 [Henningerozyma blattae CBS 6284]|uniref:Zn(2)-C6 fungal-type domain-containing protein n=1 Tax=Henningerozyma blattae (strain ATCC 34711 / CBS 6284 / DSM 70876 / NBRC 10599 / NRRL Y-10934 / UCD 77-7) TaxID=1071380 RepID=I2H690_HENB6|nr:hypothetical protein TBLA_0F03550 [Tetrapisispora blattae CBS 6284]CCH61892.1 hypothetical protein TBLA_0F03550 [Tetrapisispora blattae CBS 6284]
MSAVQTSPKSIQIINKDNSLPPLLLPSLSLSLSNLSNSIASPPKPPASLPSTPPTNTTVPSSSNTPLPTIVNPEMSDYCYKVNSANLLAQLPTPIPTPPINHYNYPRQVQSYNTSPRLVSKSYRKNSLPTNASATNSATSHTLSKRQRIGPSCDNCRLKKTKCNAKVELILLDSNLLIKNSNLNLILNSSINLHYTLSPQDLKNLKDFVIYSNDLNYLSILNKISNLDTDTQVIKHLDKLLIFTPCSNCCKKNNHNCLFSKGFTRADINTFNKLLNLPENKGKSIYDLNLNDYQHSHY